MHNRRKLFFILMLVLIILTTSFVAAADNVTSEVGDDTMLSVSDDVVVEENDEHNSVEKSSGSVLGLAKDVQSDKNESEKNLTKNDAQVLGVSNNQLLSAPSPYIDDSTFPNGGTAQQVINRIKQLSDTYKNTGGAILYLNGKTYSGNGELKSPDHQIFEIKNVKVIGGTRQDPTKMATFTSDAISLNFRGGSSDWGTKFYPDSGWNLKNVSFYYLDSKCKLFQFAGGSLTDCVIDHCQCVKQFIALAGCIEYGGISKRPIYLTNCNFTNCNQTYGLVPENPNYDDYYDGNGQFGAVLGAAFNNCNFINTTSGQHGGALCIADESEWGPGLVTSTVYNCNFINVTSRWFAIYIHGKFKASPGDLDSDEEIINCTFVNCVGTGEYAGAIGISHSNMLIQNCSFADCSGGQGAAIMVGGIDKQHDGFNGENNEANNVRIYDCNFTNNVASLNKGYTYCTGWVPYDCGGPWNRYAGHYAKNASRAYGYRDNNGGYIISGYGTNSAMNTTYELKHDPQNYTPSGNAGAVYVVGDDTQIRNCIFNENIAEGDGAAIYILGQRTIVENSKFENHECNNGTIFILGNDVQIINSKFEDNHAGKGSAIYIEGRNTLISGSTFDNNNGTNGTVYIKGNDTKIISGSNFKENNATYGGGIYIEGRNTLISGSNFDNNYAIQDGGGMYIKGDNTNIAAKSNFTENHAVNGGGIYLGGTNTQISASNFVRNNATHDGAGMYVKGNNTKSIDGSNFTENHAAHDGAGMYIEGMNTLREK